MKKHINTWVALLLVLGLCAAGIALYAGSVAPSLFGPRLIAQIVKDASGWSSTTPYSSPTPSATSVNSETFPASTAACP